MPSLTINTTADGTFDLSDPVWDRNFETSTHAVHYYLNFDTPVVEIDYIDGVAHAFRVSNTKTTKEKKDIINALYTGKLRYNTPIDTYRKQLGNVTIVYNAFKEYNKFRYELYAQSIKGIVVYGVINEFIKMLNNQQQPALIKIGYDRTETPLKLNGEASDLKHVKAIVSTYNNAQLHITERIKSITINNGLFDTTFADADIIHGVKIESADVNDESVLYKFGLDTPIKHTSHELTFKNNTIPMFVDQWTYLVIDKRIDNNPLLLY